VEKLEMLRPFGASCMILDYGSGKDKELRTVIVTLDGPKVYLSMRLITEPGYARLMQPVAEMVEKGQEIPGVRFDDKAYFSADFLAEMAPESAATYAQVAKKCLEKAVGDEQVTQ
jgi:hypothetical protein